MLLKINPQTPPDRLLNQVVDVLRRDGVVIYPTDTVYGLGCDIRSKKGIETICRLKGIRPQDMNFACICERVGIVSDYAVQVSTPVYKLMRQLLPGPYTFILKASKNVPHFFQSPRKTIGIRVVDNEIPTGLVRLLGNPILTTSLKDDDEIVEYSTDPELIYEKYNRLGVDLVIDGGPGGLVPSTVLDCTDGGVRLIRQGLGPVDLLELDE